LYQVKFPLKVILIGIAILLQVLFNSRSQIAANPFNPLSIGTAANNLGFGIR